MGERGMGFDPREAMPRDKFKAARDASFKAPKEAVPEAKPVISYDRQAREDMEFDEQGNMIVRGEHLETEVIELPKKKPQQESEPGRKAA